MHKIFQRYWLLQGKLQVSGHIFEAHGPVAENTTLGLSVGKSSAMLCQLSYGGRGWEHGYEISINMVVVLIGTRVYWKTWYMYAGFEPLESFHGIFIFILITD